MKDRQYLKKAILLCGESDGAVFKRTFVIVKKLSEGASSICYLHMEPGLFRLS